MATDIFGNEKTIKTPGTILTSEFATLTMNGNMSLVQKCSASYSRGLTTMFEAGASVVYYLSGASEGKIEAESAVGDTGVFQNFGNLDCGEVQGVQIDLEGRGCYTGSGGVAFNGALAEAFTISYQAGPTAVAQGVTLRVGSMTVNSAF